MELGGPRPGARRRRQHLRFIAQRPRALDLREWWTQDLEDYERGSIRVALHVQASAREEMLRLGLKPDSEIQHGQDGTVRIVLYVDNWQWLVPLVASVGADVAAEEPEELRQALRQHYQRAHQSTTSERANCALRCGTPSFGFVCRWAAQSPSTTVYTPT
ncbi:WYL domain-containing protein [Micromonospora tulbaghiae]|uniref:helix-turn-helix transcriptional regulator n=1 Tax=Micromonospora tulbaghiae TaxID=479978 RepID=UPI0033C4B41D